MIEILSGKILHKEPGKVIVSCGGVGYGVNITSFTYNDIGKPGDKIVINTIFKVREDDMSLFGFEDIKEKNMFHLVNSVNGIGSKTAMQLLSDIRYDRLLKAIASKDATLISQAQGIGKKTAQKIIFELKDKVAGGGDLSPETGNIAPPAGSEAVSALVRLGYKNSDANTIVAKILKEKGENLSIQEIVKTALQHRMKK